MNNVDIERIEIKKTKTVLTLSMANNGYDNTAPINFKRLLAIAVLSGANKNSIRQLAKQRWSKGLNADLLDNLEEQMDVLIGKATSEIEIFQKIEGLKTETHKFY